MSNERMNLKQFEGIIGIDWFYEDGILYLNERKFRYAIYEASDLVTKEYVEEHEQELEELNAPFTSAIHNLPNLIAELKRCYEEIDALQGKIDDAHEAMEKYSNEEIDNVCDAYEEVCMALG